jgi:hypothetical protein
VNSTITAILALALEQLLVERSRALRDACDECVSPRLVGLDEDDASSVDVQRVPVHDTLCDFLPAGRRARDCDRTTGVGDVEAPAALPDDDLDSLARAVLVPGRDDDVLAFAPPLARNRHL